MGRATCSIIIIIVEVHAAHMNSGRWPGGRLPGDGSEPCARRVLEGVGYVYGGGQHMGVEQRARMQPKSSRSRSRRS
jgi:hypothetical protein